MQFSSPFMTPPPSSEILSPEQPESKMNRLQESIAKIDDAVTKEKLTPDQLLEVDQRLKAERGRIRRTLHPENKLFNPRSASFEGGVRSSLLIANNLERLDPRIKIRKETTGDPVAHKWQTPAFVRERMHEEIDKPTTFGYAESTGNLKAREIVCELSRKDFPGSPLKPEDVLFTNGVAHAIKTIMGMTHKEGLILQPEPTYPCYSSIGEFISEGNSAFYVLDSNKDWAPDLDSIEEQLEKNPDIYAVLLINPNNPTGGLYDKETLKKVVKIAKRHNKIIISDEIYCNLILGDNEFAPITELAHNQVPLFVLRGTSKDLIVPGARGGWVEAYNADSKDFENFFKSMQGSIRAEVGATSLPQNIMDVYLRPEFETWKTEFTSGIQSNVDHIMSILGPVKGIKVIPPKGAFYVWVTFEEGVLNDRQSLPFDGLNGAAQDYLRAELNKPDLPLDKRFLLHLMGNAKLCVVPGSDLKGPAGFRVTALERNPEERELKFRSLAKAIEEYLSSAK